MKDKIYKELTHFQFLIFIQKYQKKGIIYLNNYMHFL